MGQADAARPVDGQLAWADRHRVAEFRAGKIGDTQFLGLADMHRRTVHAGEAARDLHRANRVCASQRPHRHDQFAAEHTGAAIRDPRGEGNIASMDLVNCTFSTSGDYERFFIRNGRRYHHILDPDTGEPASRSRSVTIMAKNSTVADGLSTGVFVLGAEQGMALIEKLPDVEGVIVTSDNQVQISSGLKGRLVQIKEPTNAP